MKKKIITSMILIAVLVMAVCQVVNAVSFSAELTPSSSTIAEGTEFTINLKISNLDAGNGINKLVATLDYDTTVLETIDESSIEGLNSWNAIYDSSTKTITLTKDTFVKDEQNILKIALKTKTGTTGKNATISLKNVTATCSESDIAGNDISTTITVGAEKVTLSVNNTSIQTNSLKTNNTINTVNNVTNNNIVNNVVNNVVNNTVNNVANKNISNYSTISNESVPYTGVNDTIAGAIIAVIAVAMVFYFKIEKINENLK